MTDFIFALAWAGGVLVAWGYERGKKRHNVFAATVLAFFWPGLLGATVAAHAYRWLEELTDD